MHLRHVSLFLSIEQPYQLCCPIYHDVYSLYIECYDIISMILQNK